MKTAVEWLIEAMYQETYPFNPKYSKIFEQAKEMEKEQIIEAFKQGVAYWNGDEWKLIDIEQYYNETFKSE
jgi:predicted TIM-barrel fold metal-dependent hydrolase